MQTAPVRLRAVTAYLAIAAGLISFASLEFMLEAIQDDFGLTPDQTIVIGQISGGASLLAVFLTGALADRVGHRRVIAVASALAAVGAVLVGFAPEAKVLVVGLSIGAIGTIAMAIVGVSELDRMNPEPRARARAFGAFAVIAPVVSIVVPLAAGAMVPHLGWRSVIMLWLAVAAAVFALARVTMPHRERATTNVELTTPALAGIALAAFALSVSFVSINVQSRSHILHAGVGLVVAIAAAVGLAIALRRTSAPTLDLRSIRRRGATSILTVVAVVNGVNLFFFTYLFLQYRYHQTLVETALFLVVPQLTAAIGAVLGGRASARWGSAHVATISLAAAGIASAGAFVVAPESSAWLAVAVLSIAAVPIGASTGAITQTFMDLAPSDGEAATSSFRTAAANLGVAIGGVLIGTIIFDDLEADTALDLAAYTQQADAFHLAGAICMASYLVAAVLVVVHVRRRAERLGR